MCVAALLVLVFAIPAVAQMKEGYLDAYIVQVKPEKRAEFDALAKRMAEANRRNGGDQWLTMETMYGEGNTVTFISTRSNYGDVETAMNKFYGAATKAFGAGTEKLMNDFGACLVSSRGEIRKRRWDLSSNSPQSDADYAKLIGNTRFLRTTMVRVKPGRQNDFEDMLKQVKAAREKSAPNEVQLVSQAVAGQMGTVYYITILKPNFAGFDSVSTAQQLLGEEGYNKWLKVNADVVQGTSVVINRYLPDLSNAPQEVMAVAPDYWTPKPVVASTQKKGKQAKGEPGQ
jgi:hypothetical protein